MAITANGNPTKLLTLLMKTKMMTNPNNYGMHCLRFCLKVKLNIMLISISLSLFLCADLEIDRYESRKAHKSNHNHQGYRNKKNDQVSSSVTSDKYSRSNKSNDKSSSSESLAKEIELASTIRPQSKSSSNFCNNILLFGKFLNNK